VLPASPPATAALGEPPIEGLVIDPPALGPTGSAWLASTEELATPRLRAS
jgi:hypothetical protein